MYMALDLRLTLKIEFAWNFKSCFIKIFFSLMWLYNYISYMSRETINICIPVFNEEKNLESLYTDNNAKNAIIHASK